MADKKNKAGGNTDFSKPMNLSDLCAYLQCGRNAALTLLRSGKIKAAKVGKAWRTTKEAVDSYLRGEV